MAEFSTRALRAFGERAVTLQTSDGAAFEGQIVQRLLSDDAVVLLFACEGRAGEPLIVSLDSIETIGER